MAFIDEFLDLMSDTLYAQYGSNDGYGDWVPSGEALAIPCHIEGDTRLVRTPDGNEVVSSYTVICPYYGLNTHNYRYTLPDRYDPRTDLRAIIVITEMDDELGTPDHHEIAFP